MNSSRICDTLIAHFYVFLFPSSSSKITNAIMLKLPDIYFSFDFEILSWSTNLGVQAFKIDLLVDHCYSYSLALLGLDGWLKSISSQVIFPLQTGIYLLILMALDDNSLCHQHLKVLYHFISMILHLNDDVLRVQLTKMWEKRENLQYFLAIKGKVSYFHEGTTLF